METDKLKGSIAIGAIWLMGMRLTYRLIGLISTIILARILTPDDFGVVAIAMSFMVLLDVFSRLGFQTVLIQKKDPTDDHYNTAWTFNLIFSLISVAIFISISNYAASFYNREEISDIFIVISLLFFLNGIKNIGVVNFQKEMTFDKEFKLIIIPKFISFFVTIGLAFYLRSFWALVIGNVVWKFIEVIASYSMHPFRPKLNISKANELFSFSKWLMINNLFMFINSRAPDLILGKLISPHGAAIYNISYEIGTMSTSEVIANINRSIYPGYSKVKDNISKLQDIYLTSIKAISILALPLGTGVALLSPIVVPVFLGDQWNEAIDPLFYIALAASLNALKSNTAYVLYAREMPRITTFDLAFKSFLFLSLLLILIDLNGVVGAAQAFFYSSLTSLIISFFIIKKAIMLPISVQLNVYIKPVIANLTMTLNILLAFQYLPLSGIIGIAFYTILGAVSYTSVLYIAWVLSGKPSGLEEMILNFIKNKLSFIKQIL